MATEKTETIKQRVGGKDDPNRDRYARDNRGRVIFYSPSSASAFAGCNLSWWFSKVMGEKEPHDPALDFGNAVHLVLETYLKDGKKILPGIYKDDRGGDIEVTDEHIIRAWTSLDHLPAPGQGNVEHWASRLPVYDGPDGLMLFTGKIDWHAIYGEPWAPRGPDIPTFFEGYHVLDHKTKKRAEGKYGIPSSEALSRDRQGQLYAKVVTHGTEYDGTDVLFSHNYIFKEGPPRSVRVDTVMKGSDIEATWQAQAEPARQMILIAKGAERPEDVPYNTGHCFAYGRECPFKRICPAHMKSDSVFFDALAAFDDGDESFQTPTPTEEQTMGSFWDIADEMLGDAEDTKHITPVPTQAEQLKALGFDAAQIERMKDSTKAHILAEGIRNEGVSITKSGDLVVIGQDRPAPEPETPSEEADEPPEKPKGVQPDDAAPHDDDHVRPAFVRDVAEVVRKTFQQQVDSGLDPKWSAVTVGKIAEREGLSRDWALNVALLAGINIIEANALEELREYPEDQILSVPATALMSVGAGADQDRAAALAAAPIAAFRDLAGASPRDVLLLARPLVDGKKREIIDELLDDGRLTTPFDNIEEQKEGERASLRALYIRHLGGEELTDRLVDQVLKTNGYYRRKSIASIEEMRNRVLSAAEGASLGQDEGEDTQTGARGAQEKTVERRGVYDETGERIGHILATADILGTKSLGELVDRLVYLAKDEGTKVRDHVTGLIRVHEVKVRADAAPEATLMKDLEAARARITELEQKIQTLEMSRDDRNQNSNAPFTLYAGCRPIGNHHVPHVSEFLAAVDRAALKRVRMLDGHGAVEHWSLADFGKGKMIFIQELRSFLANNPLPAGGEYHYPRNSVYQDIPLAEMFEAAGAKVIVGAYG